MWATYRICLTLLSSLQQLHFPTRNYAVKMYLKSLEIQIEDYELLVSLFLTLRSDNENMKISCTVLSFIAKLCVFRRLKPFLHLKIYSITIYTVYSYI